MPAPAAGQGGADRLAVPGHPVRMDLVGTPAGAAGEVSWVGVVVVPAGRLAVVRTGRAFAAEIERNPGGIDGCTLVRLRGELVFAELPALVDRVHAGRPGDTLDTILDRTEATSFGHLTDYLALFRHVHAIGIRHWRCVVIDADSSRGRFLAFVAEVAQTVGVRFRYRHVFPGEDPFVPMRALMAAGGAELQPPAGRVADMRRALRAVGNQINLPGLTIDLEREPFGLPNSFLATFTGQVRFLDLADAFDAIRHLVQDGTFNIVTDQREAVSDVTEADLVQLYRHFRDRGVRTYRTVVVGARPGHRKVLQRAEAIARALGLDASIGAEEFVEPALLRLARMMGRDDLAWRQPPSLGAQPLF